MAPEVLLAPYIKTLSPYIPGKPIEETQREYGLRRVVKLASNENPLGPSPKAVAAMRRALTSSHRYPDANGFRLKEKISRIWGIPTDEIILANGSNEVMDFAVRTFCVPGDELIQGQTSFIAMRICAQIQGVQVVEVPHAPQAENPFSLDLDEMLKVAVRRPRAKLVYLPNPNNPTGASIEISRISKFLSDLSASRPDVLVILDDAYWGYSNRKVSDLNALRARHGNVLLLRTFSKIFGLAGARVGVGMGPRQYIEPMQKVRMPFNVGTLSLVGAEAALSDLAFVKKASKLNAIEREKWYGFLAQQGVPYIPSDGNFVLAHVQRGCGKSGLEVFELFLKLGVILRPVANYGLKEWIRISVGLPQENRFAMSVWKKQLPKKDP